MSLFWLCYAELCCSTTYTFSLPPVVLFLYPIPKIFFVSKAEKEHENVFFPVYAECSLVLEAESVLSQMDQYAQALMDPL